MLKLFTKSILRSLLRQKLYTGINIIGLALGFFSFSMIMLFVLHEEGYDDFHTKGDRIYRVTSSNAEKAGSVTPYIWARNLKNDFPEVENYTSFQILSLTSKLDDIVQVEEHVVAADSTFFEIFDFPVLEGNEADFLEETNKIVITPEAADRYFKGVNPIGQKLEFNLFGNFVTYEVQGVVRCPKNSHLQFDFLIPNHLLKKYFVNAWFYESWRVHFVYNYLLLRENTNHKLLVDKLDDFLLSHAGQEVSDTYVPDLQALRDIYLKSNFTFDFEPRGSAANNSILKIVAFGILLIAIMNFINISTSQSLKRAKEVGLKKVLGTSRGQLIFQFIGESIFVSFLALFVTVCCIILSLSYFNSFTGKEFSYLEVFTADHILFLGMFVLLSGLLSGIYPAFLLSSFQPLSILGSRSAGKSRSLNIRKTLVAIQFALAVILLTCTGVIYHQVRYMQNKDLGFDHEQVVVIKDGGDVSSKPLKTQLLREQLSGINAVQSVTASSTFIGRATWWRRYLPQGYSMDDSFSMATIFADHDFLKTYGVKIVAGRDYDRTILSDSMAFLMNESALDFLSNIDPEWENNPFEKDLTMTHLNLEGKTIGIFEDFHYESMKNHIQPLILYIMPSNFQYVQLRISTNEINETLADVEQVWKRLFPKVPFNYNFTSEEFSSYFESEKQLGTILSIFAVLAILLGALGLFGLASFLAVEKSKEMSIRKVIGASEKQLTLLLGWSFLRIVLLSNLIGIPISFFLMNAWLEDFIYRDNMPVYAFLSSLIFTVLIAGLTVAYHSIRTALVNPVEILSQE